jgi:hypothetical protein
MFFAMTTAAIRHGRNKACKKGRRAPTLIMLMRMSREGENDSLMRPFSGYFPVVYNPDKEAFRFHIDEPVMGSAAGSYENQWQWNSYNWELFGVNKRHDHARIANN